MLFVLHSCISIRLDKGLFCSLGKLTGTWLTVSQKDVPGTIRVDGEDLFCNQIHLNKLTPALCGGLFNYVLARILLFPISSFMQFDVGLSDGSRIDPKDAEQLLGIVESKRKVREWKKGDLMILNNATMLHGKIPHRGAREILVAMCGSLGDTAS